MYCFIVISCDIASYSNYDAIAAYPHLGTTEYCALETFNGRCNDGEVIEVKSARYGRMHIGKCVKKDRGKF